MREPERDFRGALAQDRPGAALRNGRDGELVMTGHQLVAAIALKHDTEHAVRAGLE